MRTALAFLALARFAGTVTLQRADPEDRELGEPEDAGSAETELKSEQRERLEKALQRPDGPTFVDYLSARKDAKDLADQLHKDLWNRDMSQNKSQRCNERKQKYANTAREFRGRREQFLASRGKHMIFNTTEQKLREQRRNKSLIGLWVATDEPQTEAERKREKFERSIKFGKILNKAENATAYQAKADNYDRLEVLYKARVAFYKDAVAQTNASLQVAKKVVEEYEKKAAKQRAEGKETAKAKKAEQAKLAREKRLQVARARLDGAARAAEEASRAEEEAERAVEAARAAEAAATGDATRREAAVKARAKVDAAAKKARAGATAKAAAATKAAEAAKQAEEASSDDAKA